MELSTLARIGQGQSATVRQVNIAGREGVRLTGLGVLPGVRLTMIRNGRRKTLLVESSRTLIALGRPLAEAIVMEKKA